MPASPKSEPRSLTPRGAATRSRIVEAAANLIYAHGVERTSLDDVMAASGVSKSQLYHYFADKDALVLDVIAKQTERVLEAQRLHLGALDSLPALRAWRNAIVRLNKAAQGRGCPLGSLASELANDSPHYLQTTGFLLTPDGKILNAVYSSGPIGRLVAEDVIGMVTYVRSKA